ncbi:MAG: hypothetical protein PVH03_01540 [Chloroflexota bacterium]|jgi:hypothetical protein
MRNIPWYEKYSFIVFLLIAVIGMVQAIKMMIAPETGMNLLADFGYVIPNVLLNESAGITFYLFLIQWIGATMFGGDFLTACIALTVWRKGEKWAWFAFLYWPFLFIYHFSLYRPGPHKYLPLIMLVLVAVTLVSNARRFLAPVQTAEPLRQPSTLS